MKNKIKPNIMKTLGERRTLNSQRVKSEEENLGIAFIKATIALAILLVIGNVVLGLD